MVREGRWGRRLLGSEIVAPGPQSLVPSVCPLPPRGPCWPPPQRPRGASLGGLPGLPEPWVGAPGTVPSACPGPGGCPSVWRPRSAPAPRAGPWGCRGLGSPRLHLNQGPPNSGLLCKRPPPIQFSKELGGGTVSRADGGPAAGLPDPGSCYFLPRSVGAGAPFCLLCFSSIISFSLNFGTIISKAI